MPNVVSSSRAITISWNLDRSARRTIRRVGAWRPGLLRSSCLVRPKCGFCTNYVLEEVRGAATNAESRLSPVSADARGRRAPVSIGTAPRRAPHRPRTGSSRSPRPTCRWRGGSPAVGAILAALIAGETDPERLADCTDVRLKASRADIVAAVHGRGDGPSSFPAATAPDADRCCVRPWRTWSGRLTRCCALFARRPTG